MGTSKTHASFIFFFHPVAIQSHMYWSLKRKEKKIKRVHLKS